MKSAQFQKLAKQLLPGLPGFVVYRSRCVVAPFSGIYRGFHFDPSGFDKHAFYLHLFFQPLWVPSDTAHLTFGHRIGAGWNANDANLVQKLAVAVEKDRSFLLQLKTAADAVNALRPFNDRGNPHSVEAYAYSLILAKNMNAALAPLEQLSRTLQTGRDWEREIAARAELVRGKLEQDPAGAVKQLKIWERETAHNLKLEKLLDPDFPNENSRQPAQNLEP